MPKRTIKCPNCNQLIPVDIQQLFDVYKDPGDKQRLLSGQINFIECPFCGYQGMATVPIVYHDPEKELLLTFVPPEINISRDEQEKIIGSMITDIMNRLPNELRKAYLFNPQPALTFQGLLERILEADGITKDMIQAQQEKLKLIQQLMQMSQSNDRVNLLQEAGDKIDLEFLTILRQLVESAVSANDQNSAQILNEIYNEVLTTTEIGKELQEQSKEVEAVINKIRQMGNDVSREKVLEMVINSESDTKLRTIVSLMRPVMDYVFFQLLSDKIDNESGEERQKLETLRTKLLELTAEVDEQIVQHRQEIRQLINQLMGVDNINDHISQILPVVDEFFIEELNLAIEEARKEGDLEKSGKLQSILDAISKAGEPPKEIAFIENLMEAKDAEERAKLLRENDELVSDELLNLLSNLVVQAQSGGNSDVTQNLQDVYRQVLRFSMKRSMK